MVSKLQVCGSVRGNFICTWTIIGFSSLDSQVGKCHESDMFQLEENGKEWYLEIYPGGQTEDEQGYVSCHFYGKNYSQDLKWKYDISLRNSDGVILFDKMAHEKWVDPMEVGFSHFKTMKAKDLAPQLIKDVLVVVLEATYCATSVDDGYHGSHRRAEIIPLEHVIGDWRNLWKSKRNTDCVISVKGQDIPVHSLVLSTRSEVFAAMFEHKALEKSSRRVEIADFDKDTMKSLMEFIYTGNVVQMSSDLALEVLRAGDKYRVNNLKSYCTNYLMSVLNKDNACQIFASAYICNADRLHDHTVEYIRENLSEDYLEVLQSVFNTRPDIVGNVLEKFLEEQNRFEKQ